MFDDSISHSWIAQRGPIELRHTPKKDTRPHDLRAAGGIILGVAIAANFWIWSYVVVRAFW